MPSNVKDISSLHIVVLRSNKFYGSVGCGMPNATRPIIEGLASNNFSGKLSIKALANSKSLMVDNEAQSKYLQSDVEQGNELYYQDVIIVTIKGLEIKLVKILTLFTSIDPLCNKLMGQYQMK